MTTPKLRVFVVSLCAALTVLALSACGAGTSKATATTTATATVTPGSPTATISVPPSATPATTPGAPAATSAPAANARPATATTVPTTAAATPSSQASLPAPSEDAPMQPDYLDDRSGPAQLMQSYYNAINRHEYLRAYWYWSPNLPAGQLPAYDVFARGYADTAAVELTIGTIIGDVGAGQLYYSVPVALVATTTDGTTQTFAGCYQLHLARPQIQAAPPFQPLAIERADVRQVDDGTDPSALAAQACPDATGQAVGTPGTTVDGLEYVDNRSTPADVLRSLYNAINRHEYARAYAYWEPGAAQLPPFDQFQQGYAQTTSVQLATGALESDPGAGQLNYALPATLVAQQADGSTQTFVGCYRLHLSQPAIQATPPFQPLAITSGELRQVDNGADTGAMMATACQQ